jgi:hypothetical protein
VKRISNFIAAAALAALALASCDGTVVDGDEPPVPEYTTPAKVLKAVQISFNQGDVNYLKASLSPNFVFYFDPDDVGQMPPGSNYIIPESWSYTEFWQVGQNLFEKSYAIKFGIPTRGVGEPGPEETTYDAQNITIGLLVMIDEVNGYIVDNGYCNFRFERYEGESGRKFWRLTDWWDYTAAYGDGKPGAAPTSFGRILALYN